MVQARFLARRHHDVTATSIAATVAGAVTFYNQYSKTDLEASSSPSVTTEHRPTSTPPDPVASNSNLHPRIGVEVVHPSEPRYSNIPSTSPQHARIFETDFVDKLSSKPYLNYHNSYTRLWGRVTRRNIGNTDDGRSGYKDIDAAGGSPQDLGERPRGVPRRIRILSIDVPELREIFDGECQVNLTRVYPDDIAPPKAIKIPTGYQDNVASQNNSQKTDGGQETDEGVEKKSENSDTKKETPQRKQASKDNEKILVLQKSLARSLVQCRNAQSKRIGVELLEASVYDLNPHNMRRTYRFGSYRYEPGNHAYVRNKNVGEDDMLQRRKSVGGTVAGDNNRNRRVGQMDRREKKDNDTNDEDREKGIAQGNDIITESDAPWNQYAWIEEMHLRINGHIPFGANVERSSFLSRIIFGNCYCQTVKSSRSFLRWFIPSFLSGDRMDRADGIDGDFRQNKVVVNRASSKPHAVIADGAAMQRVPGALRYLTKCCAEADIPLFIINDPRVWGGNTHSDLASAAKDMRKTLKARIVSNALTIREGKMFERGRLLGKMQTETKWQFKDVNRKTRDALQNASARMKKERDEDWSNLTSEELMQQFIDKKIITVPNEKKQQQEDGKLDAELASSFSEICLQLVANISAKKLEETKTNGAESEGRNQVDSNIASDGANEPNTGIPA